MIRYCRAGICIRYWALSFRYQLQINDSGLSVQVRTNQIIDIDMNLTGSSTKRCVRLGAWWWRQCAVESAAVFWLVSRTTLEAHWCHRRWWNHANIRRFRQQEQAIQRCMGFGCIIGNSSVDWKEASWHSTMPQGTSQRNSCREKGSSHLIKFIWNLIICCHAELCIMTL